jgi:hypothetical protein
MGVGHRSKAEEWEHEMKLTVCIVPAYRANSPVDYGKALKFTLGPAKY